MVLRLLRQVQMTLNHQREGKKDTPQDQEMLSKHHYSPLWVNIQIVIIMISKKDSMLKKTPMPSDLHC